MNLQYRIFLSIWAVVFIFATIFWIFKNNLPPSWDQAHYLEGSAILHQTLTDKGLFPFIDKATTILETKAPLVTILPIPLYLIFGSSLHVALIVNVVFAGLFFIFFYKLTALIFDRRIAIASILIISTTPLFYGLARYFFVEFGLATFVVMWMYLILKTENLTNKKYLFLLGIVSGLGMLMKFHFFIFVAGPALVVFYRSYKKVGIKVVNWRNAVVFSLPVVAIAGPWYARNIITVLWKAKRASNPELLGNLYYGAPLSYNNLYHSGLDFINGVMSPYWFFALLVLIVIFFQQRKRAKINYFLLLWFMVPFLIFYLGPNKDYRLMLPLLPPLAMLVAWLLAQIAGNKHLLASVVLAIFPALVFFNTSVFETKLIQSKIALGPFVVSDSKIGDYVQAPRDEDWPITETLNFLWQIDQTTNGKIVMLSSEDESFNVNNLRYYAVLAKLPLDVKSASYFPKGTDYETIRSTIERGDYLIMKVGGRPGPADLNRFKDLIMDNLDNSKWLEMPNNIVLPDDGRIKTWQKIS
ncbi:MAG: glycosyltransferase family 39 protein [Candidatus Curtissbacteria bacterium]